MFYITISNGLLKDGHRKRIGTALWEFMWCIDKVTKIDDKGNGWVLGGKPIKLEEIADEVDTDTISRNLTKLEEEGYILKIRTPYGISIRVLKAKKRFGNNAESIRNHKNAVSLRENAVSNKTIQLDSNRIDLVASDAPFSLKEEIQKLEDSSRRDLNIIALYLEHRKPDLQTKAQYQEALKRHLRPAKTLISFTDEQILNALDYCKKEYPEIYTIETLLKKLTK